MRLIYAEQIVHIEIFDEEKEEYHIRQMTVEEMIALYTEEQQLPTVDAVPAIDWHYLPELPNESDEYMITWEGITGERYVSVAWYDDDENHFIDTCYREDYYKVIAWTEPPKPAERKEEWTKKTKVSLLMNLLKPRWMKYAKDDKNKKSNMLI